MSHFIYSLKDPVVGKCFYVGASSDPFARYSAHLGLAKEGDPENTRCALKILRLLLAGTNPELVILEEVSESGWPSAERSWIAKLRASGHPLTNKRNGGEGDWRLKDRSDRMGGSMYLGLTKRQLGVLGRIAQDTYSGIADLIREAIDHYWVNHDWKRSQGTPRTAGHDATGPSDVPRAEAQEPSSSPGVWQDSG